VSGLTRPAPLAGLAAQFEAAKKLRFRVTCADGSVREGTLLGADASLLAINVEHQLAPIELSADDIVAIDVRTPHRIHEGMLAILGIVVAVTALVFYSKLPWVDRAHGGVSAAFMIMFWAAAAVFPVVLARTGLRRWLSKWRPLYPPEAGGTTFIQPSTGNP
jgi:hypothetical protein